jgi:hypothetical protein
MKVIKESAMSRKIRKKKKEKKYISPGGREPCSCSSSFFFPISSRLEIPIKIITQIIIITVLTSIFRLLQNL